MSANSIRRVVSRLILRLAIVAASLAWAGFVITHTVGDPGRGERIAAAVLDDDAARAEIVAPITHRVVDSTGLPADQQPFVADRIDQLLRDPVGARAFIDPFAGEWARMLGESDPRPSEFDLAPLVDNLVATTPGLDATSLPTDRFVVPSVPLPRVDLPWLGGVRRAVAATSVPLAIAAAMGFATAFAIGDRRWVLRRFGLWAAVAGAGWVVVPAIAVWIARRWAPGADAVVAVAVEEAVSGLRPTALVLLTSGIAAFAASFALALAPSRAEPETPLVRRARPHDRQPVPQATSIRRPAPAAGPSGSPRRSPDERNTPVPDTPMPTATMPVPDQAAVRPTPTRPPDDEDDADALWRFYS